MKKVRTILCAFGAVALLASTIMSCSKEEGARTDEQNGRGTIAVSVTGCTGEYSQIEDTKSDLISNIRVSWKAGDKVYAYDGEKYLGELTVSVKDGSDYYAMLTAESIEAPAGNKIILVHSNAFSEAPAISDGKIVLDMSAQTCSGSVNATPFLAYGTLDYVPGQKIEGKIAEFKMASSIMRLNCSGLEKSAAIKSAGLKGMSNKCVLEVSDEGVSVGQGELGDIDMSFASSFAANANGATTIYVAIAKNGTASAQTMELNQTKSFEWNFGSRTRDKATAFNAVCPMNIAPPHIVINGLKWARQNLAISPSGNKKWKGDNSTAVKVPGIDEDVINGDFFQWAAYAGYCGNAGDDDKGLLIYESFTSMMCGAGSSGFTFKSAGDSKTYLFSVESELGVGISPYYSGSDYEYYKDQNHATLDRTGGYTGNNDDVANIILGGSWRMPTGAEFDAMKKATYWAWDGTDKGYYVYAPNPSTDAGKTNGKGTGTYNKSNALLFFPAAGEGCGTVLYDVGNEGYYWSSSLCSNNPWNAFSWDFRSSTVYSWALSTRYFGLPVRPVSD